MNIKILMVLPYQTFQVISARYDYMLIEEFDNPTNPHPFKIWKYIKKTDSVICVALSNNLQECMETYLDRIEYAIYQENKND